MGAEKIYDKMPETLDFMQVLSIFIHSSFTDSGQNQTVDINGIGGQNRLIIENGRAYMQEADCPDKLCVKQGNISMKGQSIICLPHKVVAEIVADDSANENDSVDIIVK